MEDKTGSDYKARKPKKFNARIVADNIMKGVIVLIMMVIFVMIADQIIGTPFISAEIEGEFFTLGGFQQPLVDADIRGPLAAFRPLPCALFGQPFIALN